MESRKRYWWTYLQGSNGNTDIENRLLDTVEEEEAGMIWESIIETYTLVSVSCSVVPNSLRLHGLQPSRLLGPWDFPGKDTGVGWHFLLQGIFPTQGSNPGLLHCRQILYWLSCLIHKWLLIFIYLVTLSDQIAESLSVQRLRHKLIEF